MCRLCRDCQWWGRIYTEATKSYFVETPEINGRSTCGLPRGSDKALMGPSPSVYYYYGADSPVEIMTAPDFGCVQFAPKEASDA